MSKLVEGLYAAANSVCDRARCLRPSSWCTSYPACDKWGDSATGELLRQLLEREAYHSASTRGAQWTQVKGVQVIATARLDLAHADMGTHSGFVTSQSASHVVGPASPSNHAPRSPATTEVHLPPSLDAAYVPAPVAGGAVSQRLLAQFRLVHVAEASDGEVVDVLSAVVAGVVHGGRGFSKSVADIAKTIIPVRAGALVFSTSLRRG